VEITCPYGEIIQYIHMGYGSIYSNKLIFNIIEGVVIDVKDITNQLPPMMSKPPKPPTLPPSNTSK
jgi:hypothetical protein